MYWVNLKYEAAVAQLVEHHVANVNVTSSSLVSRSNFKCEQVYLLNKLYEAAVAQLVEHHVANVNVTSSSLVSRSKFDSIYYQSREPISTIKNTSRCPGGGIGRHKGFKIPRL